MHEDLERAFSLEGRVAAVTGAASGIGRETARVLAQAGAHVVVADLDEDGLAETAAEIEGLGGTALVRPLDVARRPQVEAAADEAARVLGRLDIWVNAAGVLAQAPILEETEAQLDRLWGVNLKGTYWGCAAAGRIMRPRGAGSIVNISSGGADSPGSGLSAYAMTKAGVNMLTRTAAKEFGPFGVRVNAVAPGWVDTAMTSYRYRDAAGHIDLARRAMVLRQLAQISPLGLTGAPRDIALSVLYLASDAGRFVTGQVLRPNGGVAMP